MRQTRCAHTPSGRSLSLSSRIHKMPACKKYLNVGMRLVNGSITFANAEHLPPSHVKVDQNPNRLRKGEPKSPSTDPNPVEHEPTCYPKPISSPLATFSSQFKTFQYDKGLPPIKHPSVFDANDLRDISLTTRRIGSQTTAQEFSIPVVDLGSARVVCLGKTPYLAFPAKLGKSRLLIEFLTYSSLQLWYTSTRPGKHIQPAKNP